MLRIEHRIQTDIRKFWRLCVFFICIILSVGSLTSCKKVPAISGMNSNQLLKIGRQYVTKDEANVLLCVLEKNYADMFGTEGGTGKLDESTLAQYIKEQLKTQLVQLSSMELLAKEKNISLEQEEVEHVNRATEEFLSRFSEEQRKQAGFEKKTVDRLYTRYALSEKVYQELTKDIDVEISDEQARIIDVQVIFFKTYKEEDGSRKEMSAEERGAVTQRAYEIWERVNNGESFETLAIQYNEGDSMQYHIGYGEMEEAFDNAAFQLSNGQISGLVDGEEGIYIIKCLSNYNQAETDANKLVLYDKFCTEKFNEEYDAFMEHTSAKMNEEAWDKLEIEISSELPDVDFRVVYEQTAQETEALEQQ